MKVAVLPNLDKRGSAETVERLGNFLKNEGIEAFIPENICSPNFKGLPEDELYKSADIVIVIGGDGTIIRYAKRAALDDKPVLGINAGRVGFLANVEQNELHLLSKKRDNPEATPIYPKFRLYVLTHVHSSSEFYNRRLRLSAQAAD